MSEATLTMKDMFEVQNAKDATHSMSAAKQQELETSQAAAVLKAEIGGDVILLEAPDAASLAARIEQRFGLHPTVLDHQVRLEIEGGHRFVTDVVEAFPGEIDGVSIHKPSLEDVFIRRTGHRFWTDENPETPKE